MAKAIKSIKAFIPLAVNDALFKWCARAVKSSDAARDAVQNFIARDPGNSEWSTLGITNVMPGEDAIVHDLDGAGYLFMYRFAERKLPASVRDEELKKRYEALVEKEGRNLNKKEFAQLRDDVEIALLPKAFIVPKTIPVIVTKNRLYLCTSSASMAEKIMIHLSRLCETRKTPIKFDWSDMMTAVSPSSMLTQIVRDGFMSANDDSSVHLEADRSAVFKGSDKRAVRIKDRDLSHEEFTSIVNSGEYAVTELLVRLNNEDGLIASTFTMTDKFVFKGIKLNDIIVAGSGVDVSDLHATYWLFAKEIERILNAVTYAYMDGQEDEHPDQDEDDI